MKDIKKKGHSIITYGAFDMFHIGHLQLFQKLNTTSETLVISVSTAHIKQKLEDFLSTPTTKIPSAIIIIQNCLCHQPT